MAAVRGSDTEALAGQQGSAAPNETEGVSDRAAARVDLSLEHLLGRWHLARCIEDRRAGLTGRLEGEALWAWDGAGGLKQTERGVLHYGTAPPMQAERVYLWRQSAGGLEVCFEDGRPFHSLLGGATEDRHHCDPDVYDVRYGFDDWPDWTQTWHVTGPRKDAVIHSRFSRA